MKKHIPIEQLKPCMYMVGMDKPWLKTPFFIHRRRIKGQEEITLLKQYGIRKVTIDPTRGDDVEEYPGGMVQDTHKETPQSTPKGPTVLGSLLNELPTAKAVRAEALAKVQGIFEGVKTGTRIDSAATRKVVTDLLDILRCPEASLLHLQMRQFDDDLFAHAVDVCITSLVVAKEQGLDEPEFLPLGIGALLHDVGTMRLPRNLLRKRGAYTDREQKLMQAHPQLGAAILSQSENIPEKSCRIVAEHHERANGTGYPAGLKGEQISLLSRIVSITDLYDSMITGRDGQLQLPPAHAFRKLYRLGTKGQFDLGWVERTIRSLGVYPVGTLVELNTGEWGVVIAGNPADTLKPLVKLIRDDRHLPYPQTVMVDLSAPADCPVIQVLRTGEPSWITQATIRCRNGIQRSVEYNASPFFTQAAAAPL